MKRTMTRFSTSPAIRFCASKRALKRLNNAMALDLVPDGIRSNTSAPTYVETPITKLFFEDEGYLETVHSKTKLGRLGHAEDLVGAVIFLASDASSS